MSTSPNVLAVHASQSHSFCKTTRPGIELIAGHGVRGDAHYGTKVQHLSRVKVDPTQPNLRQVHLIHSELFDEVEREGFLVGAGQLGENITTEGLDLLGLPRGTVLHLGPEAVIEVTGLRNPCVQIENFQTGLLKELVGRDDLGNVVRRAGVMAIVLSGGEVHPGDTIDVVLPAQPHLPLEVV